MIFRFLLLSSVLFSTLFSQSFEAYTENMPPYNYVTKDSVKGCSTHLLKEMLQVAGYSLKKDILTMSWAKSYDIVLHKNNSLLYSTARTKAREDKFQWVGPIDTMQVGIMAKKSKNIVIGQIHDLNSYSIAVLPRSLAEEELLRLGVREGNLDRFALIASQLKKLRDGRVDMLAFSIPAIKHLMQDLNMDVDKYEVVYTIKEIDLYFAFNKDVDAKIIKELNLILADIKKMHQFYSLCDELMNNSSNDRHDNNYSGKSNNKSF